MKSVIDEVKDNATTEHEKKEPHVEGGNTTSKDTLEAQLSY